MGVFLDAIAEAGAARRMTSPLARPSSGSRLRKSSLPLLQFSGLAGVEVKTIGFEHHVSTADELWHGLLSGTVRTSALIVRQPEETRQRIRAAFDPTACRIPAWRPDRTSPVRQAAYGAKEK